MGFMRSNGKRLSAAEPTVTERASAAWRRINLVGLDRPYGGAVGSVSFSAARGQAQRAAHSAASRIHGNGTAPEAHWAAPEVDCEARSRTLCRARHAPTPACVCNQALHGMLGCLCRSRWPPATGGCDGGEGHPICDPLSQHMQAPELAMRAARDLDGGHAPHEGLRVLARLWVRLRHGPQVAGQRQARGLGDRCQQPVVALETHAARSGR